MTIVKEVPGNTAVCDPIETGSTTQREDQVTVTWLCGAQTVLKGFKGYHW